MSSVPSFTLPIRLFASMRLQYIPAVVLVTGTVIVHFPGAITEPDVNPTSSVLANVLMVEHVPVGVPAKTKPVGNTSLKSCKSVIAVVLRFSTVRVSVLFCPVCILVGNIVLLISGAIIWVLSIATHVEASLILSQDVVFNAPAAIVLQ